MGWLDVTVTLYPEYSQPSTHHLVERHVDPWDLACRFLLNLCKRRGNTRA